jgi:hypothetical protein
MRKQRMVLLTAIVACGALTSPAHAQVRCPEGRTASGECVNPALAQSMRQTVIAFTQPKFSYTSPPYLPTEDRTYFVPRDAQEFFRFFGFGRPP